MGQCLLLLGLALILPANAFAQTAQSARDADRGSQFYVNCAAASAATEKVFAKMTGDLLTNGQAYVDANISNYDTLVPTALDNPYWTNFIFSSTLNGATNSIYILPSIPASNSFSSITSGEMQGLKAYEWLYRIQALAQQTNNPPFNLIGGSELDVSQTAVPLFEFAIFYNSLLEFTTAGVTTIQGPVHANSNIYVGSGNPLTFNGTVTTTGVITNPAWAGDTQADYTGTVTYNGTPQVLTGQPAINLPCGINSTAPTNMIQIIYPSPSGEDINSSMGQQRYYNKAGMVIMVSNTTFYASNNMVIIKLQSPNASDPSPMWFTNINPITFVTNATWKSNNFDSWLSTATNTFYDFRQQQYMRVTQIDVSKFNTWCSNSPCIYSTFGNSNKFTASMPLNIIYVGDWRATNTATNVSVRLVGGGSTNFPSFGLTVATPDPLYVWGNYNTPTPNNLNSTNVIGTYPASFISDALTILSANWLDSYSSSGQASARPATNTTVNGAIITGVVYSTGPGGPGTTQYSGGVHNMPRLLENWSNGSTLTLNTSMVNLYPSQMATAPFVWPSANTVYGVPSNREFYFNQNYTTPAGLPPGTPMLLSGFQRVGQKLLGAISSNP